MPTETDVASSFACRPRPGPDTLRKRIDLARGLLTRCTLCGRRCGANRLAGEPTPCRLGGETWCQRQYVSYVEDADLVPALRVYFGGCNLRCRFCNTAPEGFEPSLGWPVEPALLAAELSAAVTSGVRTIDLLGGEPSLHPHTILSVGAAAETPLPIVLDTNLYFSPEVIDLLDGVVAVYLANLKYGNDDCARALAGVERYVEVVTNNVRVLAGRGAARLRYLLVPGHVECCLGPMVRWLDGNLPGIRFDLVSSYVPCWQAVSDPSLGRLAGRDEIRAARRCLAASGLDWRVDGDGPE